MGPKTEEIDDEIPDSVDGVEERNLNVVDATREPKLTISEWNKLNTGERPCSKEEWGGVARKTKWKTLGNLGFTSRGDKEEKKEEPEEEVKTAVAKASTPGSVVPPQSANPPPKPPSALCHDRRGESVDAKVEKGKTRARARAETKEDQKGGMELGSKMHTAKEGNPHHKRMRRRDQVSTQATRRENSNGVC